MQRAPTHASCYGNKQKQSCTLLSGRASRGGCPSLSCFLFAYSGLLKYQFTQRVKVIFPQRHSKSDSDLSISMPSQAFIRPHYFPALEKRNKQKLESRSSHSILQTAGGNVPQIKDTMCVVCMAGNLCRAGGLLRNSKEGGQGRKPLSLASNSGCATVVRLRGVGGKDCR